MLMEFGKVNYVKNSEGNKTFAAALSFLIKELDKPVWSWLFRK